MQSIGTGYRAYNLFSFITFLDSILIILLQIQIVLLASMIPYETCVNLKKK